ncbi:MAG: YidC/Oxa1 family membrane protein insertase, partial [Candidatus Riflebacteria bacterium]|nr:YidC/Oxa1 family membrane protein insertase [Candidatus Riflebacteria bacterium]
MSLILYRLIISPLEFFIENLFAFFYYFLQLELGSSLFFISFAVTLMCLPFYYRADKIRKEEDEKFSEFKPYVDKIKKNFKGDEQFFMLQTLYRQHNYNPIMALRNSFSLLLQIPFFIAAYHFFSNLELLDGYSWGPILNFSKPDMLLSLGEFKINILPILMTVVNIISCEVYLKTKSFSARIQPYSFALIFLFLLYNSPSALVLYWTSNNFFYLLKNKYMNDDNPLKFVYGLSAFMTAAFVVCKLCELDDLEYIVLQLFFLFVPFVVIYLILKYRDCNHDDFKQISKNLIGGYVTKFFVICCLGLVLLQGVIIPLGLLTSDISMFTIEFSNTDNIVNFVFENILCVAGLYLLWGSTILYLAKEEFRAKLVVIFIPVLIFALFNYLSFGKDLGTLDTSLRFETPNVSEIMSGDFGLQSLNVIIFASILAITIWMLKKSYIRQIKYILLAILFTEIIVSGVSVSNFVNNISY